ncbi:MAG: glycosyltransferase [Candidatus Magasanikbacteria bacterium]|nr:glycosyltransferase [Candidatus Magasanikbacteria bacterium]
MTKPQKILHIIPRLVLGGAEVLVSHYANKMDFVNYDVHVASVVAGGSLKERFKNQNCLWVGDTVKMGGRFGVLRKLKKYISELQPDIIHTHLLSADVAGYLAKRRLGKKIRWVVTLHNVEFNTLFLKRWLWRWILKKADAIVAVSPAVARYAQSYFAIPKEKINFIPNGIDLTPWLKLTMDNLLTTPKIRLAIIGRLEKQKGHAILFRALSQLKNTPWTLDIFGVGSLERQLRALGATLGIGERLGWRGAIQDIPAALADIDVVLQPSLWEGMSLVVMEALAAGRVVVASTAAAAGENLIVNEETGYIVDVGDYQSLGRTLRHIIDNRAEAKKVAVVGRNYAGEHFSIEKHIEKLTQLYETLV